MATMATMATKVEHGFKALFRHKSMKKTVADSGSAPPAATPAAAAATAPTLPRRRSLITRTITRTMTVSDLCDAIRASDVAACRHAIKSGTNVNTPDDRGWLPLSWACEYSTPAVVQLLLEAGALPNARDTARHAGREPIWWAIVTSLHHVQVILSKLDLMAAHGATLDLYRSEPDKCGIISNLLCRSLCGDNRRSSGENVAIFHHLQRLGASLDYPHQGFAVKVIRNIHNTLYRHDTNGHWLRQCLTFATALPIVHSHIPDAWAPALIFSLRGLILLCDASLRTVPVGGPVGVRHIILTYVFGQWAWLDDQAELYWMTSVHDARRRVERTEQQLEEARQALDATLTTNRVRSLVHWLSHASPVMPTLQVGQ
jgi:hypothetical protein